MVGHLLIGSTKILLHNLCLYFLTFQKFETFSTFTVDAKQVCGEAPAAVKPD